MHVNRLAVARHLRHHWELSNERKLLSLAKHLSNLVILHHILCVGQRGICHHLNYSSLKRIILLKIKWHLVLQLCLHQLLQVKQFHFVLLRRYLQNLLRKYIGLHQRCLWVHRLVLRMRRCLRDWGHRSLGCPTQSLRPFSLYWLVLLCLLYRRLGHHC